MYVKNNGDYMNETIGAKGGHNDLRKALKIKEKKKKKNKAIEEDEALRELEKKVKRQQRYTLIKTLPIIIVGGTVKTFYDTSQGKKSVDLEEDNSKWKIKEYGLDHTTESLQEKDRREKEASQKKKIIVIDGTGRKIVVEVPLEDSKKDETVLDDSQKITTTLPTEKEKDEKNSLDEIQEEKKQIEKPVEEVVQNDIPMPKAKIGYDEETLEDDYNYSGYLEFGDVASLPSHIKEKFEKLKARKIIDEYEKQLKDVRYDLRKLIFDYNVLVAESDEAIVSKETEIILDKLSEVINKIEELKRKIRIEDLDKYDDNYIYTLIEGYLEEFRDKKLVSEIKDSPLYILISEKLDELDTKKDALNKKVEEKKEGLEDKEKDFEKLKEKFFNLDKINKELVKFQDEQNALLKEVQEKVLNAVDVQEKVQVEVEAMSRQSRRLLRMITLSMFFPGARSAKSMATSAAAYLYFMNNILRPKTVEKKYKVITVKDYSKDIENSIKSISDAYELLGKTSKQVDKMISLINEEFKDYIGVIPECDELLSNLRKLNSELKEKEYEMDKMKKEQELVLEKNNSKVKTMGTYPM